MSTERHNPIDDAAGDWLARRDSGDWSGEDQRRFDAWLGESPLHRVAFLRIEHVWERTERLKALGAGIPRTVGPSTRPVGAFAFLRQDTGSVIGFRGCDAARCAPRRRHSRCARTCCRHPALRRTRSRVVRMAVGLFVSHAGGRSCVRTDGRRVANYPQYG